MRCLSWFVRVSWTGTTEENLNKLIQHVKIENEREFILNWKELGVNIISSVREGRPHHRVLSLNVHSLNVHSLNVHSLNVHSITP